MPSPCPSTRRARLLALERELAHVGAKGVLIGPGAGAGWAGLDRSELPNLAVAVSAEGLADTVAWEGLPADPAVPVLDVEPDHLAVLMFTSGTAGHPQAAMLSHGNLLANIDQNLAGGTRQVADDVVFGVLPLFHIFGLNVMLGITLRVGARASCSSSASTRRPASTRSASEASRSCPARPRCGWRGRRSRPPTRPRSPTCAWR